jgi:hypothetical protein
LQLAFQSFESVAWRALQVRKLERVVQHIELSLDYPANRCPTQANVGAAGNEELLGGSVGE